MLRLKSFLRRVALLAMFGAFAIQPAVAAEKQSFKIACSIYVGWMPWDYANQSGILEKWADKYGIEIELTQVNDYVESINQYTAGGFDGCVMTNMPSSVSPPSSFATSRCEHPSYPPSN